MFFNENWRKCIEILENIKDDFLEYCKTNPSYNEAVLKFGEKVFEYELLGKISIKNGKLIIWINLKI